MNPLKRHRARAQAAGPHGEMTRVHFERIAQVLNAYHARMGERYDHTTMGEMFASALEPSNPEFNRPKFLGTLGIGGKT